MAVIYAWDGRAYRQASAHFPGYYQPEAEKLAAEAKVVVDRGTIATTDDFSAAVSLFLIYDQLGRTAEGWRILEQFMDPAHFPGLGQAMADELNAARAELRRRYLPNHSYRGISFASDPLLFTGVTSTTQPPDLSNLAPDMPAGANSPEQIIFSFTAPIPEGSRAEPEMRIFPARSLAQSHWGTDLLPELLLDQPEMVTGSLPFLIPMSAGQVTHAGLRYLQFKNGLGVRYLTNYAQDKGALGPTVTYTFQGKTYDGNYYLSFTWPVPLPFPDPFAPSLLPEGSDYDTYYQEYLQEITRQLDETPGSTFTPDLTRLDTFIEGLQVK